MTENGDSDSEELIDLFPEPEGYYQPHPEPTSVAFRRQHANNPYLILINTRLIVVLLHSNYA